VMRDQNPAPPPPPPHVITYLALGFGALQIVLQAIVPSLLVNGLRRQLALGTWPRPRPGATVPPDDAGKLCLLFQSRTIVGGALAEGAAFFLLIAYLLEGQPIALGGAAVMLGLVLGRFPTRPGLESWLSAQQDLLSQERLSA